jgi:two-component system phosphate regulon sensor histidine kinase PhoR
VAAIWRAWQARGLPAGSSRKAIDIEGHELLTLWHDHGDRLAVAAASPADLMAQPRFGTVDDLAVTLADAQGRALVSGTALRDAVAVVDRLPAESGLPWTVRVGARSTPIELAQTGATRRSLITAALLMFGLLIPATAYLVFSAVRRELALAAQQSEFVASVSHEFRSPLTSLTHLTSLLRSDFQPTDERRRQYYDTLARETDRLRRFVETLLDFGRIQSGRASYRLAAVDAAALVRGVVEDFGRHAAAGARPVSFTGPPVSLPVDADADALGRAIWNLLENAAKYSPDTAPIDVEVASEGHRVAIRVSDRGPGIRADERPNIFDPFYRGAQATQSAVKGTGVGLAIVRHIVTEHGGDVRVDNRVGGGSTFAIVLPAGGDAAAADTTRRVS